MCRLYIKPLTNHDGPPGRLPAGLERRAGSEPVLPSSTTSNWPRSGTKCKHSPELAAMANHRPPCLQTENNTVAFKVSVETESAYIRRKVLIQVDANSEILISNAKIGSCGFSETFRLSSKMLLYPLRTIY